jgi:NADPH-dependent ferric siderophore reductase
MTNQPVQTLRRVRPKPLTVSVKNVQRLTPGCVRITFAGPELETFSTSGPADHIKVMFPRAGESQPFIPEWGPEGPVLKEGESFAPSRTYTPRKWRPESLELDVDFMLHGDGLASDWARTAKAGDVMAVSARAGGPWNIDTEADWYVLAADASGLPGLGTILDALPAAKTARVFVEVRDEAEQQDLESAARLDVTWLHHGDAMPGALIEHAIRDLELPEGSGRVWVGCEAAVMRNIRRHLLDDRGMDRSHIHTHGYWKAGEANHPDHDIGQDT